MPAIKKIKVTNGVYWVEIPEAQLYILCGCPADSVKYLKQRGLIVTKEEQNRIFESGPNVILLSDVLVQNGGFSNLAEFPILQMLYKQGMALPGYPKNSGQRPLIIGSQDQVKSQMQYILRGNYGLVSPEEILAAGVPQTEIHDMMGVKLHFSFGKIQPTEELLETRIIENEALEIKNEVFVRRLQLNIFEFKYYGESVVVDLNLKQHESYGPPYALGFHHIKREYFAVIHSGQGDGWDSQRPCASSILMFQGKIYLIDAGPNFMHSLRALGISINEVEGIFHTHAHDDHFADLPALIGADHRIKYYATPLVRASVTKKLAAFVSIGEDKFSDYFEIHDLTFDTWNNIDGLEVKPLLSPHPVETNIFVFRAQWGDGYHTYAHFVDIVALDVLRDMIVDSRAKGGISQAFFDKVKRDYLQKVDLKKIDIGGEFIHGDANDFRDDPSEKIILVHTSRPLTACQKEIGSGAPFGTVDVLIPTYQDYIRQQAAKYLRTYYPSVPSYEINTLLNNPIITFNPQSIILKHGVPQTEIYLTLTGNVEMLQTSKNVYNDLSAGALVGEITDIETQTSPITYRAINFVEALQIPRNLYLEFIKRNGLLENVKHLQDKREFLQTTWLFGQVISYPIQNKIAQQMTLQHYAKDEILEIAKSSQIYIVQHGKMQSYIDADQLETLNPGDFFGEDGVLIHTPSMYQVRAIEDCAVYQVPGEVLLDIPLVRWKLFEAFEKRMGKILDADQIDIPIFYWRKEYSVNIQVVDKQHRQIFEHANRFYETMNSDAQITEIEAALSALINSTRDHFAAEEALMEKHGYQEVGTHNEKHTRMLNHMSQLQTNYQQTHNQEIGMAVLKFLKSSFVDHILIEDRKYSQYLNCRSIY